MKSRLMEARPGMDGQRGMYTRTDSPVLEEGVSSKGPGKDGKNRVPGSRSPKPEEDTASVGSR